MNLIENFLVRAADRPDRLAIREAGGRISFGELERFSARLAAGFRASGIGRGDRVLVGVWPGIDLYAGLAALWRLGAVVVFPEPAMGVPGFRRAAAATRPKALLAGRTIRAISMLFPETRRIPIGLSPHAGGVSEVTFCEKLGADDPALISFTSGSTGAPKGMVRTHGLMLAQHAALAPLIASDRDDEVDLVAFPAFVLTCLGHGAGCAMPRWNLRRHDRVASERITAQIVEDKVTRLLAPPAIARTLAGNKLPECLRHVMTGGGPLYPDVAKQLLANTPRLALTVVYGSTEAEPIAHARVDKFTSEIWSAAAAGGGLPVGKPVRQAKVKLVDDEIVVSGPHVNKGYLDPARDAETKIVEDGVVWHRTGDAGRFDEGGNLWLLGRWDSSAEGLFPFSVETAARLWPGVGNAVLVAREGERAILFIEGDASNAGVWRREAARLGDIEVAPVGSIPMDRRHRSKPDIKGLLERRRVA